MKKLVFLFSVFLFSCQPKNSDADSVSIKDSATAREDTISLSKSALKIAREIKNDTIVQIVDSRQIPFGLHDEFTSDVSELIIKIKDFDRQNISGEIVPENPEMNIRFNQIRLPNGDFHGPFGREMMFKARENGEIRLIIGKSNMASGIASGKFSVFVR